MKRQCDEGSDFNLGMIYIGETGTGKELAARTIHHLSESIPLLGVKQK